MPSKLVKRKTRNKFVFRFLDERHELALREAAKNAGLSLNAWIVQATIARLKTEVAISQIRP